MVIVQALVRPPPPALQPRRPSTIALQPGRTGSSGSLLAGYKIGDDTSSTDQSCVRSCYETRAWKTVLYLSWKLSSQQGKTLINHPYRSFIPAPSLSLFPLIQGPYRTTNLTNIAQYRNLSMTASL